MSERKLRGMILFGAVGFMALISLGVGFVFLIQPDRGVNGEGVFWIPEFIFLADKQDIDGDRLLNRYEVDQLIPYSMPFFPDTDLDGISDAAEDRDEDGLTNVEEMEFGTDPLMPDSDGDGLKDHGEAKWGTDPWQDDTDGDGLSDGSEIYLGTDPTVKDTDGDEKMDGEDIHYQVLMSREWDVVVKLWGIGDHREGFSAHNLSGVSIFDEVPGLVGDFIDLSTEQPISSAMIQLSYRDQDVPTRQEEDLRLLQYDSEKHSFNLLSNQRVNVGKDAVTGRTYSLGPVGIIYLPEWKLAP